MRTLIEGHLLLPQPWTSACLFWTVQWGGGGHSWKEAPVSQQFLAVTTWEEEEVVFLVFVLTDHPSPVNLWEKLC